MSDTPNKQQIYDLIIIVYACDTIDKYKHQIHKIEDTYEKIINKYDNIKILYFLSENGPLKGTKFIRLDNVDDSYFSATLKQWYGLKYVYENFDTKFAMCIGGDTYLNIKKLDQFLKQFNPNKNLYIGGHGDHREINNKKIYFHSGGPGFILSKGCLKKVYAKICNVNEFINEWINLCNDYCKYLIDACDVAMGYLASTNEINAQIINAHTDDLTLGFYHCNYKGRPCHRNKINMQDIISCHLMTLDDFDDFTAILEKNNYFL